MRGGRNLRCAYNDARAGHAANNAPHPVIVLKMEDVTGILLPIVVSELPSILLMAAVRNVQIACPTMYQVIHDMIGKMGYTAKLVRVTKRVHEAYYAELYLSKAGGNADCISFDPRSSDAINIAVKCKIPIQVSKYLALTDGVKFVEYAQLSPQSPASDGILVSKNDQPSGKPCSEAEEFDLIHNMLIAADEEGYKDAVNGEQADTIQCKEELDIIDDHVYIKMKAFWDCPKCFPTTINEFKCCPPPESPSIYHSISNSSR